MSKKIVLRLAMFFIVLSALALASGGGGTTLAKGRDALKKLAREIVAARVGVPIEQLKIVRRATGKYPLQGIKTRDFKVMDKISGEIYQVSLDANKQEVDPAALLAAEEAARVAQYGNLEPELHEMLKSAAPDATIPVILWLKMAPYEGLARPEASAESPGLSAQHMDELQQANDAVLARAVEGTVSPVANRLQSLGVETTADKYAPVLYGHMTLEKLAEIATWQEIDQVYLDRVNKPDMDIARTTIFALGLNNVGITGTGVNVAQVEVGGRVATNNPYLSGTQLNTTYVCSSASSHSTGVAGIIRSTHSTVRGIASGATLWAGGSCNGNSSELQNRSTAAADWGARAINLSWGSDTNRVLGANDRFYDNLVINRFRSVVVSAANANGPCGTGDGDVSSPALAYNVIAVGNFDDKNSNGWTGDTMNSCSSWRDPDSRYDDREKPEISAPGTNINSTTTASPWTGGIGSGTSYAAPMVTGVIALLLNRANTRGSGIGSWPESIKATLMATAVHNIEGATRLSEYDGAGGVVANRADYVVLGQNGGWWGRTYSCATRARYDVASIYLGSGTRTRVAITWDNDPAYSSYASQPSADLDLQIVNSSGTVVSSSASWDNTYELSEFTPSAAGYYKIRVKKLRCDYSPRYLGVAYFQGN